MANFKSGLITAKDSVTAQIARAAQGVEHAAPATYTSTGALAANDIIFLAEIPVEARITSLRLWADDLGTTGTFDVGFYPGNLATSAIVHTNAVDKDAIGTAINVNSAAINDVEIRFETLSTNTIEQAAWQLAGLSARPAYDTFFVAITVNAATDAAGKIAAVIRYIP
jgi:hypothetical protein